MQYLGQKYTKTRFIINKNIIEISQSNLWEKSKLHYFHKSLPKEGLDEAL